MDVVLDIIKNMKDPFEIFMALAVLYAFKTLGDKLKKIDHIDSLISQVKNLVDKVDDLITSREDHREEVNGKIREIESDLRHISERVAKLEALKGD